MKRFFAIFFFIFSMVTVIILLTKNRSIEYYRNRTQDAGRNDESNEDRNTDSLVQFKKTLTNAREKIQQIVDNPDDLSERQKQILDFITGQGEATMQSIAAYLKSVTPRTLRRDLQKLIESELIAKFGKTKNSRYKIQK